MPEKPAFVERVRIVNPYHAVSVSGSSRCCQAAKELTEVRFLSGEAPKLPLKECDAPHCECRYVHHDDRRAFSRRTTDGKGFPIGIFPGKERRRARTDRRLSG